MEPARPIADGRIDKSRYWLDKCSDSLCVKEAEEIDIVQAIESVKVWEDLGIFLPCNICEELVGSQCLHCDNCDNFQVCSDCIPSQQFRNIYNQSHEGHNFVQVFYRPVEAPLHDGSDLELLQAFANVKTEEKFYIYFPFLFHDIDGMDEFAYHNRAAMRSSLMRETDHSTIEWIFKMETLKFPTDWFVRRYGSGNWESLHKSCVDVLIQKRVPIASISSKLYKLLTKITVLRESKEQMYGEGDTPPSASATTLGLSVLGSKTMASNVEQYMTYTLPLQVGLDLNNKIQQAKVEEFLPTKVEIESWNPEVLRPFNLFNAVFPPSFENKHLTLHRWPGNHAFGHCFMLKPEWVDLFQNHMEVLRTCDKSFWNKVTAIPLQGFTTFLKSRASSGSQVSGFGLPVARQLRERGCFDEAIDILKAQDLSDPVVAFELQRVYEDQGYVNKETEWFGLIQRIETEAWISPDDLGLSEHVAFNLDGITNLGWSYSKVKQYYVNTMLGRTLLRLVREYQACFSQGKWNAAVNLAEEVWTSFLKDWNVATEHRDNYMLLVHIELYYHRIFLAALRDQSREEKVNEDAVARLRSIQYLLLGTNLITEAWDVLQLRLELLKTRYRSQYLEHEAAFSVTSYSHKPIVACPLLKEFISRLDTIKHTRTSIPKAQALLLMAHLLRDENPGSETARIYAKQAEQLFLAESSEIGLLDVKVFHLKFCQKIDFKLVQPIYSELEARKDYGRLRELRKVRVDIVEMEEGSAAFAWQFRQRASLSELAAEAGNFIEAYRWKLRRYAADSLSGSFLADAEAVLAPDTKLQSASLMAMATFNLAKGFMTQGNYLDAATYALLHVSLVNDMADRERAQRGLLLLLDTLYAGFSSHAFQTQRRVIGKIALTWNGWLSPFDLLRWQTGDLRADEMERFIQGALFLPRLAGCMGGRSACNVNIDEEVTNALVQHLTIAFSIIECLPTYTFSIILPRLALALGAAADYAGNKELACRVYDQGLQLCHSGDVVSISNLRLEAGKALVSLTAADPEHWAHVLHIGRSLLHAAADGFLRHMSYEGAIRRCCDTQIALLNSYVAEARGIKFLLDRGVPGASLRMEYTEDEISERIRKGLLKLSDLGKPAREAFHTVTYLLNTLREELNLSSDFEKFRNLGLLASGEIANKAFDLAYEIAYIFACTLQIIGRDAQSFAELWTLIQARKSAVLQEKTKTFQNADIIEDIRCMEEAWSLYKEEASLIMEGKNSWTDFRLQSHRSKMREIPELRRLLENREAQGATFESLKPLSLIGRRSLDNEQNIVLVDWSQYHDYYFICLYDITDQKLLHGQILAECSVKDVESWRNHYLEDDTDAKKTRLDDETVFTTLQDLVKPMHKYVKPGSLLIFSPSQALNAIPLHAIPFKHPEDLPVIYYHPVVYCPSAAILTYVVAHSLRPTDETFHGTFHGRYGDSQGITENDIANSLQNIANEFEAQGLSTSLVTGKKVTKFSFDELVKGSHLIHFHGHAHGDRLSQHLLFESTAFSLQDAFTIKIPPAVVMLIACGSNTQDIALNDNALGLVSSFFAAGATTIVGTLWPIDTKDGLEFSSHFYRESFLKTAQSVRKAEPIINANTAFGFHKRKRSPEKLINLAEAMRKAVLAMRASDNELCMEDEDERHMNPRDTWRWAGYVMQGSWVCQGFE